MSDTPGQAVSPEMRVVPYLSVHNGAAALDFYARAFEAETIERYDFDGTLGHATVKINDGILMLADEFPIRTTRSGMFRRRRSTIEPPRPSI